MKSQGNWKSAYENLMRNLGFHNSSDADDPHRKHSRLAFRSGSQVAVRMAPISCQIINVSVGGMSFYSDLPLPSGHSITIIFDDTFSLDLRVDSSHIEEVHPVLMVTTHKYIVGAKFLNEEDGYRLMAEVLRNHGNTLFERTV